MWARYERAERFCEWNVRARVRNVTVSPHWLADGDRFWFERQVEGGAEVVLVDPVAGTVEPWTPPSTEPAPPPGALRSPDGRLDLVLVGDDLGVLEVDATGRAPRRLTHDGAPDDAYGAGAQSSTTWVTQQRAEVVPTPVARWSPDGRRVVTHRLDQRQVPELHLLESSPPDSFHPRVWSYRMPLVGDPLATTALVVVDVEAGTTTAIDGAPLLVEWGSALEIGWVWWDDDGERVWFLREDRGARRLALCVADASTGAAAEVVVESSDEYVEPHPLLPWASQVRVLADGQHVLWSSERSGWRHLEVHRIGDDPTAPGTALTSGEWAVREVLAVDDTWVWFTACGREPGRDPYHRHVYRVRVAGGEPELLTPEDADHACVTSPSGRYLLDTASTIDTAPVTRLRAADGTLVLEVVAADLTALHDDGWVPPERFMVTAADGRTPLHGVLYKPTDFDPSRRYPVVDAFYPGPQLIRTPKSFTVDDSAGVDAWPGPWFAQAIAELGCIVVNVDGHGTPLRSRAFHHASHGHLEDPALDDHVAALRALAADRPWMDLGRGVGAQGHSGGAQAAVRALLARPDVYTVGVAGSGVHDLRRYVAYWGEKYQGLGPEAFAHQANADLAAALEGHLLLIHGELDDNVHPANTLALYDAFVRADKDVDLVLLAGWPHPCWTHPHYVRRTWDHLVRHLLGEEPPVGYRVDRRVDPPLGG